MPGRFASIAKLAGEQLKPYIAQLVPKLYRYQHDPNPRVRDAMTHIWRTLIDNPKEVRKPVSQQLLLTACCLLLAAAIATGCLLFAAISVRVEMLN